MTLNEMRELAMVYAHGKAFSRKLTGRSRSYRETFAEDLREGWELARKTRDAKAATAVHKAASYAYRASVYAELMQEPEIVNVPVRTGERFNIEQCDRWTPQMAARHAELVAADMKEAWRMFG